MLKVKLVGIQLLGRHFDKEVSDFSRFVLVLVKHLEQHHEGSLALIVQYRQTGSLMKQSFHYRHHQFVDSQMESRPTKPSPLVKIYLLLFQKEQSDLFFLSQNGQIDRSVIVLVLQIDVDALTLKQSFYYSYSVHIHCIV